MCVSMCEANRACKNIFAEMICYLTSGTPVISNIYSPHCGRKFANANLHSTHYALAAAKEPDKSITAVIIKII